MITTHLSLWKCSDEDYINYVRVVKILASQDLVHGEDWNELAGSFRV